MSSSFHSSITLSIVSSPLDPQKLGFGLVDPARYAWQQLAKFVESLSLDTYERREMELVTQRERQGTPPVHHTSICTEVCVSVSAWLLYEGRCPRPSVHGCDVKATCRHTPPCVQWAALLVIQHSVPCCREGCPDLAVAACRSGRPAVCRGLPDRPPRRSEATRLAPHRCTLPGAWSQPVLPALPQVPGC